MSTTAASRPVTRLRSRELSVKAIPERQRRNKRVVTINKSLKKNNTGTRGKSSRVSKGNKSLRNSQVLSIRLRPRRNRKNYCEDSKLLQQHISPKQHDSVVVLEKLHLEDKKVPVYKAVEPERPSEKPSENKDDVYDFKFDSNDKREKAVKKNQRKRATNKGKGKTMKKTIQKKSAARPKAIKSSKPDANLSVEIAQSSPPLELAVPTAPTKKDNKDTKRIEISEVDTDMPLPNESINENIEEVIEPPRTDTNIQEKTLSDTFVEQIKKENANKPRVISIENANNIVVTKAPCNPGGSWPFRPKNIFDNKTSLKEHDSTSKNSLLIKTLSPILKTTNTLDFGSPWRPPALMFSQTKHFIQSTPYKHYQTCKENKEINKKSVETNKENMEMDKENKVQKNKESKKKAVGSRKIHAIKRKLPVSENQPPKIVRAVRKKPAVQPAPARVSLGEIKNLLQRPNVNGDNKPTIDEEPAEVDKSHIEQKDKKFADFLNFSDTFDVMSETERLSTIGNDIPLFVDLEPSHFSKPPQHSYRRKRAVKFDFSEESDEEEKENVKLQPRKKKPTKSEKEQEKRINEWVKTVNTTFQEIEEFDLIIE